MKRKIFIQLVKEFWVQTILSILWSFYKLNSAQPTEDKISLFITNFSVAFFLLSWGVGQYVRVKKQQRIEDSFDSVKKEIGTLLNKLEVQTKNLIGYSTGGDSIAYFQPSHPYGTTLVTLDLLNKSEFPVFDIFIDWIDLDEKIAPEQKKFWTRNYKSLEHLYPSNIIMGALQFDLANKDQLRINLWITTRNRNIQQQIRVAKVNGVFKFAHKTTSGEFQETEIFHDFPGYDKAHPEKVFE